MTVYVSLLTLLTVIVMFGSLFMVAYVMGYERGHFDGRKEVKNEIKRKHKATKFVDIRAD